MPTVPSRNAEVLGEFTTYCKKHPELRFWQALRNWAGMAFIYASSKLLPYDQETQDTFYWEGKNG